MAGRIRQTHTVVILEVSRRTYSEIEHAFRAAGHGYDHVFLEEDGRTIIDMSGIALAPAVAEAPAIVVEFLRECEEGKIELERDELLEVAAYINRLRGKPTE